VLFVAKGYEPTSISKVDPAAEPLEVVLQPLNRANLSPKQSLHGRVMDPQGKAIEGAVVNMLGIRQGDGGRFGSLPGVDPMAVTDEQGEFLLTAKEPFDAMDVQVEARTFAHRRFLRLASGERTHELRVTKGATVSGRVLAKDKPLKDVVIGLVSVDRGVENFTGEFVMGTDEDGRFLIPSVPPNVEYYLYGKMDSAKSYGAIPAKKIRVQGDDTTFQVGDLAVQPGLRLAGNVVLKEGQPVPPNTRLTVGREAAWDSQVLPLSADGSFEATGLSAESLSVSVRVKGYRLAGKNRSLEPWNPLHLVGRLDADKTNLVILLERGADLPPNFNFRPTSEADRPQNQPLRGAEVAAQTTDGWAVSGRVTDAESRAPIARFSVTPGFQNDRFAADPQWEAHRVSEETNGTFTFQFGKRDRQPLLLVEADGYLPAISNPLTDRQTNLSFALQRGSGPKGQLALPGGDPVAEIDVFLLGSGEQVSLMTNGQILGTRNSERQTKTDAEGRFSFRPFPGDLLVAAANAGGFIQIAAQALATNAQIVLQPWGRIEGKLLRGGQPVANEKLDVTFDFAPGPQRPRINIQNAVKTDASGQFVFENVPSGAIQIATRKQLNERGWMMQPEKHVVVPAGGTVTVEIKK
jgi:hypothetical protein